MWPWWLYGLSLASLGVLMAVEPAVESRTWAVLFGVLTPIFMFVGMQIVIDRGRDADVMAGASTILVACMIVFTSFRPGLLVKDQLTDESLAQPHVRYRILAGRVGIALAAWYATAGGA